MQAGWQGTRCGAELAHGTLPSGSLSLRRSSEHFRPHDGDGATPLSPPGDPAPSPVMLLSSNLAR